MEEIITIDKIQYILETQVLLTTEQKNNIINQLSKNKTVNLAPSYSFAQGSVHNINITASNGIAPYKYSIIMDSTEKATDVTMIGTTVVVPYTFNESIGVHTLKVSVKDSCGIGIISNQDISTITISAVPADTVTRKISIIQGNGTVKVYLNTILKGTATKTTPISFECLVGDILRRVAVGDAGYVFEKYCTNPTDCSKSVSTIADDTGTVSSTILVENGYYFIPTCQQPSCAFTIST